MKKILKALSLALAVVMMMATLAACGSDGGKSGGSANVSKTYNLQGNVNYIDAIGWYHEEIYTLQLNSNDTYQLYFNTNRFGAEDCDMRGLRTIIYTGKYTSAASSDGEPSHLDVNLEAATQIVWEQHGKGFTRVDTLPGDPLFFNTAEWTDAMTASYDPDGNAKGASDFLAEFAKAMTITVEDPSLDTQDTTLTYRIVGVPDLGISMGNG